MFKEFAGMQTRSERRLKVGLELDKPSQVLNNRQNLTFDLTFPSNDLYIIFQSVAYFQKLFVAISAHFSLYSIFYLKRNVCSFIIANER